VAAQVGADEPAKSGELEPAAAEVGEGAGALVMAAGPSSSRAVYRNLAAITVSSRHLIPVICVVAVACPM
jgi:hypothetical protein